MTPKKSRAEALKLQSLSVNDRLDRMVELGAISSDEAESLKQPVRRKVPSLRELQSTESKKFDLKSALGL